MPEEKQEWWWKYLSLVTGDGEDEGVHQGAVPTLIAEARRRTIEEIIEILKKTDWIEISVDGKTLLINKADILSHLESMK